MMSEKKVITLRNRFVPAFWSEADGRSTIVREIRRRVDVLVADCGADSEQKRCLCQRAVFIALQLETMERTATEKGRLDLGVYTQASNALLGLLKALGLDRKAKGVHDLKSYVNGRNRS
jgi:hypothetical protein